MVQKKTPDPDTQQAPGSGNPLHGNDTENIKVLTSPLSARPSLREPLRILHTSDTASFRDPENKQTKYYKSRTSKTPYDLFSLRQW